MPTAQSLNDLRKRILEGEEPSRDELRSSIQALVGERLAAAEETQKKAVKKRAPAVKVDLDDLLG